MNKKDIIYLIIVLALTLIFITAYVQKPTSMIVSNCTESVECVNSVNSTIPGNIMELCRSKADQYYDFLKPRSCKDNGLGVAYSLRLEATGDLGTNYYLADGSLFYNCGGLRADIPEGYEEKCALLQALDCRVLVEC